MTMKEQGNFGEMGMNTSDPNRKIGLSLPETRKLDMKSAESADEDRARKLLTRIHSAWAPIGDELSFDGSVGINLGKLPKEPVKQIPTEEDDSKSEQKPFKTDGRVKKFLRKFAEFGSATAVLASVGSAIPAIAEEVPADVALEVNVDKVREAINSSKTAEPSPAPTAEVTILDKKYDEDRYAPYIQEVKDYGCTDEATAEAYGRFLFTRDNDLSNSKSLQKRVSRESILEGSINGGKSEEYDVYSEDGVPMFLFAYNEDNHDSTIIDGFVGMINWFKDHGCPNVAKSFSENGLNIIYSDFDESFSDIGGAVLSDTGLIVLNMDCESLKEKRIDLLFEFIDTFSTEPFGIAQSNAIQGIGELENLFDTVEINKSLLSGFDLVYRYIQTGENYYYPLLGSIYIYAADCFAEDAEMQITDPYLIRQLYLLVNGDIDGSGLVKSLNLEPWSEIFNTLAIEVLGLDGVDIANEAEFTQLISQLHDKIPQFVGY